MYKTKSQTTRHEVPQQLVDQVMGLETYADYKEFFGLLIEDCLRLELARKSRLVYSFKKSNKRK